MLVPKRVKYRFQFRGKNKGLSQRGYKLDFGEFGLKAEEGGWVSARQIEAARKVMTHYTRRGGRVFIRIFPDKPITKKPAETRMGSGKGAVEEYVAVVKPGRILFEMAGVGKEIADEALRLASHKLPIDTRVVNEEENEA